MRDCRSCASSVWGEACGWRVERLSDDDFARCIKAVHCLGQTRSKMIKDTYETGGRIFVNCSFKTQPCRSSIQKIMADELASYTAISRDMFHENSSLGSSESVSLCKQCQKLLREHAVDVRKNAWKLLPSYFGLKEDGTGR